MRSIFSASVFPRLAIVACATLFAVGFGAMQANAAEVVTKTGKVQAQLYYPTYTALVVVTYDNNMITIPTDQVVSIDGVPYSQAYWNAAPVEGEETAPAPAENAAPTAPAPGAQPKGMLMPFTQGSYRLYDVTQARTTWVRHGRTMERRPGETLHGISRETVAAAIPGGAVAITQSDVLGKPGDGTHEVQFQRVFAPKDDGTYLLSVTMEDAKTNPPKQEDQLSVPPRLWPLTLDVGQTWVVGPYQQFGQTHVSRVQVVGRETVSVPAGTYPDAYKVVSVGDLCGGHSWQQAGRLVNQDSTIETVQWIVPGLGPVKEVAKRHFHQTFFPKQLREAEVPVVTEERTTRILTEFNLGAK